MMYFFLLGMILNLAGEAKSKNITPPNYLQSIKCIPEIKNDFLKVNFSLNALKEQIDQKFLSLSEKLVARNIYFTTRSEEKRVLRIKPKDSSLFELVLESIDKKGVLTPQPLPEKQKMKAVQEDINQHLLNVDINSDEKTYDDTKLNNHKLGYQTRNGQVVELVFRRAGAKVRLYCRPDDGAGSVCVCK